MTSSNNETITMGMIISIVPWDLCQPRTCRTGDGAYGAGHDGAGAPCNVDNVKWHGSDRKQEANCPRASYKSCTTIPQSVVRRSVGPPGDVSTHRGRAEHRKR